jgi:ribosomal protein S12 methylthiotransferase accessory factor
VTPGLTPGHALAVATAAGAACGVTRLGDITGLDRLGVPVFHAIRPLSRALCVHQGKGLTAAEAQLGALMEAVESAHAESFEGRSCIAPWQALSRVERPACLSDFGRDRANPPDLTDPMAWSRAERLTDGRPLLVPFDSVSLDCVGPWDRRLNHTSNGLAARFDFEGAALKGLLEVLERDAVAIWRGWPLALRAFQNIEAETIPYPWFGEIAEVLRSADLFLSLYSVPSLIGLPVVCAEVFEGEISASPSCYAAGWACAPAAEDALRGALLEALQVRLTYIAGARDDILYDETGGCASRVHEACALPPDINGLEWRALEDAREVTPRQIAERLAEAGYPDVAVVRLSAPEDPVCVVKVFAPGLAANTRTRREPLRELRH